MDVVEVGMYGAEPFPIQRRRGRWQSQALLQDLLTVFQNQNSSNRRFIEAVPVPSGQRVLVRRVVTPKELRESVTRQRYCDSGPLRKRSASQLDDLVIKTRAKLDAFGG